MAFPKDVINCFCSPITSLSSNAMVSKFGTSSTKLLLQIVAVVWWKKVLVAPAILEYF